MPSESELWDEAISGLAVAAREYLGEARSPDDVARRCVELLAGERSGATAEWSSGERCQCTLRDPTGSTYGYGATPLLAALDCFRTIWHYQRYVPSLPGPTPHEAELIRAGQTIAALESYVRRTGAGLGDARIRLWL